MKISEVSSSWTKYWSLPYNYTMDIYGKYLANCVPLDKDFYAIDANGTRLTDIHPMDYKLISNPYGTSEYPIWNLPNNAVYVAPPWVSSTAMNTWTKHTQQTQTGTTSRYSRS